MCATCSVEELAKSCVISPHVEQALHSATSVREVELEQGGTLTLRQSKSGHIEAHVGKHRGVSSASLGVAKFATASACSVTCLCASMIAC